MKEKSKSSISLILPAYNEADAVIKTLKLCVDTLEKDFEDYEIIVVDDGSKDKTLKLLLDFEKKYKRIKVLQNYINLNQGISIQRAMTQCSKDYVLHNGIDLPLQPVEIKNLVKLIEGHDLLILERKGYSGATNWRKFVSKCNKVLRKILFPVLSRGIKDMNFVQLYNRKIIAKIMPLAKSPAFTTPEMIFRARYHKLNIITKAVKFQAREIGTGSLGKTHDILWSMYDMFRFRYLMWIGLGIHGKTK